MKVPGLRRATCGSRFPTGYDRSMSKAGRSAAKRGVLILLLCLAAVGGAFWLSLPSAEPLRGENPSTTALIEARAQQARAKGQAARRVQTWVPLRRISPWLQ